LQGEIMSSTPKTLNVTEQHQLLDELLNKDAPHKSFRKGVRNYCMACLMLEAGLRVGEVTQLLITDLVFNLKPVTSIVVREEIAKNHKERIIPISTRLSQAISQMTESYWPRASASVSLRAFYRNSPDKPLTTRQVERIIRNAGLKAIGRPVHPHILRHTFATKLMRVTDMRTVQELLGHSNMASTEIYTHPNADDKKSAIEEIDRYMSQTKEQNLKELGPHPLTDHLP